MAWTTKVLAVLGEHHDKEGRLKSKWEITRPENEEGKHFSEGLQKTSFYMKDGELKRGYPQALTKYDLRWIKDNWAKIGEAIDPPPGAAVAPKPAAAPPAESDSIEEVPF